MKEKGADQKERTLMIRSFWFKDSLIRDYKFKSNRHFSN